MIPNGLTDYQQSYEKSPIILVNGICEGVPGGMLPVISLLNVLDNPVTQSPSSGSAVDTGGLNARFIPMSGATVIDNQIGMYPFANQSVAANAIITQPLAISLLMIAPVNTPGGYALRRAAFTNLQAQLYKHSTQGGTFNVATPAFLYTDCILSRVQDATPGEGKQAQTQWRFDFIQPLLTIEAARQAQNALMSKLGPNGTQVSGDPPSASTPLVNVGNPNAVPGAAAVPVGAPLVGASGSGAW
jgi:hypothetical protein